MIQSEQHGESRIVGGTQEEGNDTRKPRKRKRVTDKQEVREEGERERVEKNRRDCLAQQTHNEKL